MMVLGLMPGMSLTALAWDGDPYASLLNTTTEVTFDGKQWYLIENNSTAVDAGTVTLLSKKCVAASKYDNNGSSNTYEGSTVETAVNTYYNGSISSGVKSAVVDNKMFLLTINQANAMTEDTRECTRFSGTDANYWWLCGGTGSYAACVDGLRSTVYDYGLPVSKTLGVRPALKLNLESVIFSSESKTFSLKPAGYSVTLSGGAKATTSGGATSQTGLTGAMTTVTYTANTGYYFAEFADISSNGITARRTSSTVVTVSGTPTADATITVPDAVAKTAATVTKAPTAKTLTYTGSAQELVTAGTATGGEMQYALGTATEATEPYTTSIPQKINAGTYYVWYKVVGDENHFDTEPIPIEAKISEAPKTEGTPAQTEAPQTQTEASAPAVQAERITIPKKPARVKTKARKNKVVVSWKRIKKNKKTKALRAMIKNVEVQYSTDPAFQKEATVTRIIKKNKTKLVLRGLTRKTLYYVRVRYLDGAGGYSRWSRVKRARTK